MRLKKEVNIFKNIKDFKDEEFKIIGFTEGKGVEKGCIIWTCITKDGKEFSTRPKGTHKFRKELFKNGKEYIGKKLTVVFQEYSADGIPRFPVGKTIRNKT